MFPIATFNLSLRKAFYLATKAWGRAILCLALSLCLGNMTLALAAVSALNSDAAAALVAAPPADFVILDVRTPEEFAAGHIAKAQNINFFGLSFEEDLLPLDRSKPYLVYCRSGKRSTGAVEIMEKMGFTDIRHMDDGFEQWIKRNHPVAK